MDLNEATVDAHYNRRYGATGDTVPATEELDKLTEAVEYFNSHGSMDAFVNAQSNLIDALLVALEAAYQPSPDSEPRG